MTHRIYTRTGDSGETGLFGGRRVAKDDLRIEAYGDVDELNAILGAARAQQPDQEVDAVLAACQNALFVLGADLAAPEDAGERQGRVVTTRVRPELVLQAEEWIDAFETELAPLQNFILPGGNSLASALHVARTVCRRAERRTVALARTPTASGAPAVNPDALRFLNRLSDLLFVLARVANSRGNTPDVPWKA